MVIAMMARVCQTAAWKTDAGFEGYFIASAPTVFVFCAKPQRSERKYGKRGVELYCLQDATIACAHGQLEATAPGLGSIWVIGDV